MGAPTTTPNQSVDAQAREVLRQWKPNVGEFFHSPVVERAAVNAMISFANRTTANPSGDFVMVPREPTREMWAAGGNAVVGYKNRHHDKVVEEIWSSMLAAAPATPSPAKQVGGEREAIARIIAPRVWSEMDAGQTFGTWWPQQKDSLAKADAILAALSPQATDLEGMRWYWFAGDNEDEYRLAAFERTRWNALAEAYGHTDPGDRIYLVEAQAEAEENGDGLYQFTETRNHSVEVRQEDEPLPPKAQATGGSK